jgi:hypothetical protein
VRCFSNVDNQRSTVAKGILTVDPVSDFNFEVEPVQVRARWSSRHVINVENRGNVTAKLEPVVVDPQHDVSFAVSPARGAHTRWRPGGSAVQSPNPTAEAIR